MASLITYTLSVIAVQKETEDAVTIIFKQPGLKKIKYQPGQYLTLIFRINGRRYIRPYSLSSAPGVEDTLNVTVKRVPLGVVSNHIIDQVKVGDLIEVMAPMGDFVVDMDKLTDSVNIFLWGVGSGITPLISIAKFLLKNRKNKVVLIYGNRDSESALFVEIIQKLSQEYQNFTTFHFYTKAKIGNTFPQHIEGRITPKKVLTILGEQGINDNSLHYICGPLGLKESVISSLVDIKIDRGNIFSEDFEIIKDLKDFDDIATRSIKISKDDVVHSLEVIKGKSILEAALEAGIELSYSCQTGNCSICKGSLKFGKVRTIGVQKTPEGLLENEYLLCCTYPLTDDVEIKS